MRPTFAMMLITINAIYFTREHNAFYCYAFHNKAAPIGIHVERLPF